MRSAVLFAAMALAFAAPAQADGPDLKKGMDCVACHSGGEMHASGETDGLRILGAARRVIGDEPEIRIEYVSLVDAATMEEVSRADGPTLLAVAVRVGKTRLIDNCVLGRDEEGGS